ncbi:MAG: hypothetical protein AAF630_08910 [Cyanobacteria bacterium P01_C01_bin.38]
MNSNQNQPRKFDVVLGGNNPAPVTGAVLGGIEGVKRRLESENENVIIAALKDALNYGEAGLDLVIEALNKSSEEAHYNIVSMLCNSGDKGKQALLNYNPWLTFSSFQDWEERFCLNEDNKSLRGYNGYYVGNKSSLISLIEKTRYPIKAIQCEMYYKDRNHKTAFKDFIDTLVEYKDSFPNLKALRIGDICDINNIKYLKSRINVCNISPLLKAYPNLELLHIRGRMFQEDVVIPNNKILAVRKSKNESLTLDKTVKHKSLRTLIIDADGISNKNLAKLCNLNLPSLEYLEIWLHRENWRNINIDSIEPILSGKYCQNLVYLAIRNSGNTNEIAKAIVNSPVMKNLKILELTDGNMESDGAKVFFESSVTNNLHTLNLCGNSLGKKMIEQLSQLNCQVIAHGGYRYYSVWE